MFSGIVQGIATVISFHRLTGQAKLVCSFPPGALASLSVGASVSIDGVCLTVTSVEGDTCSFDLIQETLDRSTLGGLVTGARVNYERALHYGDEVGGHLVSGHVDFTGDLIEIEQSENNVVLWIRVPPERFRYVFEKGYVALNGASLTIAKVNDKNAFSVSMIPETLKVTTLGDLKVGARVNLEIDRITQAVVDTVERKIGSTSVLGSRT